MTKTTDIAIIGAGPAGIMGAIEASKHSSVILIEKNETIGRKILATGNGRCNLTNKNIKPSRYHSQNIEAVEKVLKKFDQFQTMKFFESLGIVLKEEDNGRVFPRTNQAETILDALIDKLLDCHVKIEKNAEVKSITKIDDGFITLLKNGNEIQSKKVILASGGKAAFYLGSTGDGYYWAEKLGHTVTPTYPALVPLETEETWPKEISGLRVHGKSTVTLDGKEISKRSGDILFTHFGLSAPAIMYHASQIAPHLGKKLIIHLDLFPESTEKELDSTLSKLFDVSGKKSLKNTLAGIIPNNLAPVILNILELSAERKTAEVSKADRQRIAKILKDLTLTIKGLRPFKEAQVTSGGIPLSEVNPETLESKKAKGLFLAGEILDVNGDSGGFNLQWAWSSGHVAGQNATN